MTTDRTFRIRGETAPVTPPTTRRIALDHPRRLLPGVRRGDGAGEFTLEADALVRVTLDNGLVLWTRADDLLAERGRPDRATRGGGGAGLWDLDLSAPATARGGSRGALGLAIEALDCFGVDLKGLGARALGGWLEERQLGGNPPGLYRCTLPGGELALTPVGADATIEAATGPLLLFIHGTGSSCAGSFGALWGPDTRLGETVRTDWSARYGNRVFAWEHRTLTESPITNALALVRALPAGAELHLVTHSRGGLVGELLCLAERDRATDPLTPAVLARLFAADATLAGQLGLGTLSDAARTERAAGYAADRAALTELLAVLDEQRPRVRRYVRTACPASGTTLASGRLDRWLSLLGHLGGLGVLDDALDFILAVVKERTDPRTLPGLEAMLPGSALTRLLRLPDLVTTADLSVIAGDVEGDSAWGRIKLAVADWFFASDHDLVVNTGSMTGGIRRPPKGARWRRDQGPEVNHFNYFKNTRSLGWLAAGLGRRDGAEGGFEPLPGTVPAPARAPGPARGTPRGERPLAVIVPGILGSSLAADGQVVWPLPAALARGGLIRLAPGSAGRVAATGLLEERYGALRDFLAATHRVEVFPYDWRQSLRVSAAALAERLTGLVAAAESARMPVRLIAHGAGGLVVRAMIAEGGVEGGVGPALWRRLGALPQSRLLLLGTPHLGAWETLRWLTGRHPSLVHLALLDAHHSLAELTKVLAACPGLLELLPQGPDDPDFSDAAIWEGLKGALGPGWTAPLPADLKAARATWTLLRQAPPDPRLTVSVLGDHPVTLAGYRLTPATAAAPGERPHLGFLGTRRGDGALSWASAAAPGAPVWYLADTAHDALCRSPRAFPAYLDLLVTGTTARLPQAPPAATRAGADDHADFLLPERPPADAIPDEAEAAVLGFGAGLPGDGDAPAAVPVIQVRVRHGDLGYARHPVLVGHYEGDSLVSAERAIDQRLGGLLEERLQLGLYPGRIGTQTVFFNERERERPAGALVVGLGRVGELAPGTLESGVRDVLVEYALRLARWPDARFGPSGTVRSAAVCALLVGSGAGGIGVADSVKAILRGALAAVDRLAAAGCAEKVAIDRLEFLEVQHDLAIATAQALDDALADTQLAQRCAWPRRVIFRGEGGQRRVRCEEPPEWWQRLEILEEGPGAGGGEALRFIAATDRARAEVTLAAGQLRLADDFIAQASRSDTTNAEAAKTLFEMLLPARLRELAPQQGDLVLLVDETSARFPWELLEDRWSQSGTPPAVAAGMVRQLKTADYRPGPAQAAGARAFVVGNPSLDGWEGFADLPGARAEATLVAGLLRAQGYQVRDSIDEPADAILAGLHKDAWRILHLAGHGEHGFALTPTATPVPCGVCGQTPAPRAERRSGMLIGKETFLTPGDVEQMRWVPELVFINCCHLGKTRHRQVPSFPHLAANLAVQFVRMGVRAVIAAGWAVNDAAGLTFAECFYTRMLAGDPFGEAVRRARAETWQRHPDVNTWGAYQCYGDPAYRLVIRARDSAPVVRRPYHDAGELVADLANLTQTIRMQVRVRNESGSGDREAVAAWQAAIEGLLAAVPDTERTDWYARADLAAALGLALAETGDYPRAVEWLDRALAAEEGDCPLIVWERCTDLKVLLIRDEWLGLREAPADFRKEDRRQALVERLQCCISELALMSRRAATVGRLKALANACRYLAWLQTDPRERREALVNMAAYLTKALEHSQDDDARLFPLATAARVLTQDPAAPPEQWRGLAEDLRAMLAEAVQRAQDAPSFAAALAVAENETALLLTLAEVPPGTAEHIGDLYQAALRGGASPWEAAMAREYLDFVIALGEALPTPVLEALTRIRGGLQS